MNVGTALALALIASLLAFLLSSDGESTAVAADGDEDHVRTRLAEPDQPPATEPVGAPGIPVEETVVTSAPVATVVTGETAGLRGGGDSAASSFAVLAMAGELTDMGPTEVGFVTNFPSLAYQWDRVEIPTSGGVDVVWLGELNGQLVAASPTWESGWESSTQSLATTISTDGIEWSPAFVHELPEGTWVARVVGDGDQIYALAQSWDEATGQHRHYLYTTSDGITWAAAELDLGAEENEHVYIENAAAGPAGIVLAASYETYPEEQPVLLDFGDLLVELDHMRSTYRLLDAGSGEPVTSGAFEEVFNWGGSGQRVFDPESGELLVTIPYEIWEQAFMRYYEGYGGVSPLPIPTPSPEPVEPPAITIEYDGVVVTVDEFAGEYTVIDSGSGAEVASGRMDYLYQGPPPQFVDPDSGEILLSVTWDQWYQAEEQAYRQTEARYHEYSHRTALLSSADGDSWAVEAIPTRSGGHVSYLVATDDGFLAMVSSYGEFGDHRAVWTLSDGEWSSTEAEGSELWVYQVARAGDRLFGVGDGPTGPALWTSSDGIEWMSEFAIVPQNDGSYVSLTAVASDGSGSVGALAHREKWSEYQPLVIEKDGYTFTFEDGETALTVTDAAGAVVLTAGWSAFNENGAIDEVTWDDGVTYFDLGGRVVGVTDEEAYAAMEARWTDQGQLGLSVFVSDGSTWSEAIVDVGGGFGGARQLYMIDGKIIIAGTHWNEPQRSAGLEGSSLVMIVGTPIGG